MHGRLAKPTAKAAWKMKAGGGGGGGVTHLQGSENAAPDAQDEGHEVLVLVAQGGAQVLHVTQEPDELVAGAPLILRPPLSPLGCLLLHPSHRALVQLVSAGRKCL